MDRYARRSLPEPDSDCESVQTEALSSNDGEGEDDFTLSLDRVDSPRPDAVTVVTKFARQVQDAAGRGDAGVVHSPQLDPYRQLEVLRQQHQDEEGQRLAEENRQRVMQQHHKWLADQAALVQQQQPDQGGQQQLDVADAVEAEATAPEDGEGRPLKFVCKSCPARFTHLNLLTRHLGQVHPVVRPYPCPDCGRGYASREVMEAHCLTVHRGARPYPCDQCDKYFSRSEYLQSHLRVHTGVRPYQCSLCGRRFAWNQSLHVHMRTHTGERPYLCSFCPMDFPHSGTLKYHEMIHTQTWPYPCNLCERKFRRGYDLRAHSSDHERMASEASLLSQGSQGSQVAKKVEPSQLGAHGQPDPEEDAAAVRALEVAETPLAHVGAQL